MQNLRDRLSNCICRATDRLFSNRISSKPRRLVAIAGECDCGLHAAPSIKQGVRIGPNQFSETPRGNSSELRSHIQAVREKCEVGRETVSTHYAT